MQRLGIEEVPRKIRAVPSPTPQIPETEANQPASPPTTPPQIVQTSPHVAILAVLRAFVMILSARLLLLLSLVGAFTLAVMSEQRGDILSLAVLVAFCLMTVIPMVVLDYVSRQRPG